MSGQNTNTRTYHNRGHVLTRNTITFNQSTSALSKLRYLRWFFCNDYRMLRRRADQLPHNAAFSCLIATIHNIECEILVVNSIKYLQVLRFPMRTDLGHSVLMVSITALAGPCYSLRGNTDCKAYQNAQQTCPPTCHTPIVQNMELDCLNHHTL